MKERYFGSFFSEFYKRKWENAALWNIWEPEPHGEGRGHWGNHLL